MVFMIGTDLEEDSNTATDDLLEILRAPAAEGVHAYALTGGARQWALKEAVDGGTTMLAFEDGNLQVLGTRSGPCADPDNLCSFLEICAGRAEDDENILVLWGHGCADGIGYDTLNSQDVLTLEEIQTGILASGCRVDILGFDACCMATQRVEEGLKGCCGHLLALNQPEALRGWPYHHILPVLTGEPETDCPALCAVVAADADRRGETLRLEMLF